MVRAFSVALINRDQRRERAVEVHRSLAAATHPLYHFRLQALTAFPQHALVSGEGCEIGGFDGVAGLHRSFSGAPDLRASGARNAPSQARRLRFFAGLLFGLGR